MTSKIELTPPTPPGDEQENKLDLATQEEIAEIKAETPVISRDSKLSMIMDILIVPLATILAVFQVYTGATGQAEFYIQRGLHLFLVLLLCGLLLLRDSKAMLQKGAAALALVGTLISIAWFFGDFEYHQLRIWNLGFRTGDLVTGIILVAVVFYMGQRVVGWVMPIIAALSIAYLFFGAYTPGIMKHSGYNLNFVTELSTWSEMGIFGTPIGVAASYLYLFILFGTLIEQMGTGATLIELAKSLAGKQKGGPAKIAVASSAMMGSISGSPIANVLTTGAFTIPLMKRLGFEPAYAAAVEAVASTGGMILPPVMGVLAFAMVDYSGIPYSRIIGCAAIPAIMYYLCCYFTVHFHAVKLDMKALAPEEMQPAGKVLREGWLTIVPVLILAVPLCMGYTPLISVSWATLSLIPISFLGPKHRWLTPKMLLKCFVKSARNIRVISLPCALAGIISAALSVTGMGVRMSSILLDVADGSLLILLLMVALVTIIMGCGLPSLLAYIIQLPITIPAIIAMGVPPVGAHLFVVYYATLAFITPPVGMSLFAAAGLADASFMKTGANAFIVGAAGFLVPFMFIFTPSLLLLDVNAGIILDVAFAIIAVYILAASVEGYLFTKLNPLFRLLGLASAIMLMQPDRLMSLISLGVTVAIIVTSRLSMKKAQQTVAAN